MTIILPASTSATAETAAGRSRAFDRPGAPSVHRSHAGVDACLLLVVWITMTCITDPRGDFPLNDDFLFARSARSVLDHFQFAVPSYSAPNVGPLAYWGALFCLVSGFSFTALRMSTLVLGLVGILAFHRLFFRQWKHRGLAMIAALTLMVDPLYFGLANTFMTDVPFLSLLLVSMFLVIKGMDEDDRVALAMGLLVALLAVLIRHLAIVVFVGFAAAQLVRGGRRPGNVLYAMLPLVIGVSTHLAFSHWLQASGRKPLPWPINDLTILSIVTSLRPLIFESFSLLQYLGLLTLPLSIHCFLANPRQGIRASARRNRRGLACLLVFDLLFVAYLLKYRAVMPSGTNVLSWFGLGPLTLRDTFLLGINLPPSTPTIRGLWIVVTALSACGVQLLAVTAWAGARRLHASGFQRAAPPWSDAERRAIARVVFLVSIASSYLAVVLAIATHYPLFDRYLLPLIALTLLAMPLLLRPAVLDAPGRERLASRVTTAALMAVAAVFTVTVTHDYLEWNRQRWVALATLTARGIDASRIDGGYEFNGWMRYDRTYRPTPSKSYWWVEDDEFMVASGPVAGYDVERSATFRRWFLGQDSQMLILHREPGARASKR